MKTRKNELLQSEQNLLEESSIKDLTIDDRNIEKVPFSSSECVIVADVMAMSNIILAKGHTARILANIADVGIITQNDKSISAEVQTNEYDNFINCRIPDKQKIKQTNGSITVS